ncbi:MAG: nucleoside triphosphate pyrophosphohydrolase [Candidatus Acidiferrum sp.]
MPTKKSQRKSSKPRARRTGKPFTPPTVGPDFQKLVAVMTRLRAPKGCPWDREQTHSTLRTYLIEEAYEVLDALDSTDDTKFAEELGDLLLQVLFHAQIAHEEGRFDITDVVREIYEKMIRRHPHVFGTTRAKTAADVLRNWEIIKSQERQTKQKGVKRGKEINEVKEGKPAIPSSSSLPSYLDGVPRTLPALLEALQLTRKAARIGFDWPNVDGIFAKLQEETQELQTVLANSVSQGKSSTSAASSSQTISAPQSPSHKNTVISSAARDQLSSSTSTVESELGDILFVAVNLARFLHVDPEIALKKTCCKFSRRFHTMERLAREQGTALAQIPRLQMESLWDQAKLLEQLPPNSK